MRVAVRKIVRMAVFGLIVLAVVMAGAGWLFTITPTGFLPSEDQGAVFTEVQLPEGASVNRTDAVARRVEEIARNTPGVRNVTSVVGFSLIDGLAKSNAALVILTLKPFSERTTQALSANGIIGRLMQQYQAVQEAIVFAYNLPPIIGLGTGSGFEYQLLEPQRRVARRARRGGARPRVCGQSAAVAGAGVHHLQREHAAALSRHRPREGADARHRDFRDLQRAAVGARQRLSQRLQPVRPYLAGQHPGRGGRALAHQRYLSDQRAQPAERDGVGPRVRGSAPGPRPAIGDPLQQLPQRDGKRRAGAGLFVGAGASHDGAAVGHDAAAGLRLRMDRNRTAGEGGRRQDHDHSRARGGVRLSVPGRPLRELGDPGAGALVGRRSPYWAR